MSSKSNKKDTNQSTTRSSAGFKEKETLTTALETIYKPFQEEILSKNKSDEEKQPFIHVLRKILKNNDNTVSFLEEYDNNYSIFYR